MNTMNRIALVLTLAVPLYAGAGHRRSVSPPLTPLPQTITSWTLEVTTSGGLAPALRTGIVIRSSGTAASLDHDGHVRCTGSLTQAESTQIATIIAAAHPESWVGSYVNPSNPNGCCDQIRTALTLTVNSDTIYKTVWFDDHLPLPPDLSAIYDFAFKVNGVRTRIETGCSSATAWTLEMTEEGGFGGNYHHIVIDQSGSITVQPNARAVECHSMLSDAEVLKLNDAIQAADGKVWAASYVRPENPTGCCDQYHTKVRLTRTELATDGTLRPVTYTTEWYSDHLPLPADLLEIQGDVFGANGVFQRYGPRCES
jgi:hypothetical protein